LTPSLIDVRVQGNKVGKINEEECDKIIEMIRDFVIKSDSDTFPRSIGVISLVGDEQGRLIRGRLLDAIGPQKYKEHDILIGDAATFQGGERDIIFLSMVCSPGRVPTQSQLMYAQRANVALSRARDRMVLVRSIDSSHVPSMDDVKIPILEFFAEVSSDDEGESDDERPARLKQGGGLFSFRHQAQTLLEKMLHDKGYSIRNMGVVWNDAICVEDRETGRRAAVCFESAGESTEEWTRLVKQQKSIERVGWKTFRVDGLSFLADCRGTLKSVESFLSDAGVGPQVVHDLDDDDEVEVLDNAAENEVFNEDDDVSVEAAAAVANEDDAIVISSDEDDDNESISDNFTKFARGKVDQVQVKTEEDDDDGMIDPSTFGDVANLGFLRGSEDADDAMSIVDDPYHPATGTKRYGSGGNVLNMNSDGDEDTDDRKVTAFSRTRARAPSDRVMQDGTEGASSQDDVNNGGQGVARASRSIESDKDYFDENSDGDGPQRKRRRRHRTRLDKYARDGRYYPGRDRGNEYQDDEMNWYDTDSDLPPPSKPAAAVNEEWRPDANAESEDEDPLN
jgi:hypothetical protein